MTHHFNLFTLRVFSGGLDDLEVSFLPRSWRLKAWKFISVRIKENLGMNFGPPGTGYPTVPPSAEAPIRHAGPGPSFGTFCRAKVSTKSTKEGPFVRVLVYVPTMTTCSTTKTQV